MPDIHRLEHPEAYLDPEIFARPAFEGQQANLFAPESAPLKEKLHSILEATLSLENLEFLDDMHKLNSQEHLSKAEVYAELQRIEDMYIAVDGPKSLNIQANTLKNIRKDPLKSILNYNKAIKEIFQLINANVTANLPILKMIDTVITVNNSARNLVSEMDKLIQIPIAKPRSLAMFKTITREAIFIDCQNYCKKAQIDLLNLVKDDNKDASSLRTYNKQKIEILQKLSAGFKEIQKLESVLSKGPKLSPYLEKMISDINELDKEHASKLSGANRRISTQRDSERSSRSDSFAHRDVSSVIKSERDSVSKINLSMTPRSNSKSVNENDRDGVRQFRNSSRAVPIPRENSSSPSPIENNDDVPSKNRPRR
jgi:hypothetical protein